MAKLVTVRSLLVITVAKELSLHQLDINNVYLHDHIDEELYMKLPEGYTKGSLGQVYKLQKSHYGLKQARRQWNKEF